MDLETNITNKDLAGNPESVARTALICAATMPIVAWLAGNAWGVKIRPAKPHEVPGGDTTDVYHVTHYKEDGRLSYNQYMDTGKVGEVHTVFNQRDAAGRQIKMDSVLPSRKPLYDKAYPDAEAYENSPAYQRDNRKGK
jgi:hypothetical protein